MLRSGWPPATPGVTQHFHFKRAQRRMSWRWAPVATIWDARAADGSATMQMRVSLGEERPWAVVEKHMGLGHPNVHLRETRLIFCDCQSEFKRRWQTSRKGKSSVSIANHCVCMTATSRDKKKKGQKSWCHHRSFDGVGATHPARHHDDSWHLWWEGGILTETWAVRDMHTYGPET